MRNVLTNTLNGPSSSKKKKNRGRSIAQVWASSLVLMMKSSKVGHLYKKIYYNQQPMVFIHTVMIWRGEWVSSPKVLPFRGKNLIRLTFQIDRSHISQMEASGLHLARAPLNFLKKGPLSTKTLPSRSSKVLVTICTQLKATKIFR